MEEEVPPLLGAGESERHAGAGVSHQRWEGRAGSCGSLRWSDSTRPPWGRGILGCSRGIIPAPARYRPAPALLCSPENSWAANSNLQHLGVRA